MKLAYLLVVTLFAAAGAAADTQRIKIVSSLPRTGSSNAQTTSMVNGIRMAIEERNSKAGPFEVVYEDWDGASPERGTWDPAVEAANADKAIRDPDVMAYIGTYNSGAAKVSMPKLNQAGLAMVSPANTWPGLTKPGIGEANEPMVYRPSGKINYFRVVPADDIQGRVGAAWAAQLGAKKVFIVHDRELYGKGIAEMFKRSAPQFDLEVLGFEGIDAKASNYRALVTKIRQKSPDLVFFGGITQSNAGQLAKDIYSSNLKVKLMFPDGCFEQAFIDSAGGQALNDRAYITFGGVPPQKLEGKGKQFYEGYKKRYGTEPEAYSVYAYDAAKVVLNAIEKAGKKDRAAIIEILAATKGFDGALGTWSFDENGDTTLTAMSGNVVKEGKFAFDRILND